MDHCSGSGRDTPGARTIVNPSALPPGGTPAKLRHSTLHTSCPEGQTSRKEVQPSGPVTRRGNDSSPRCALRRVAGPAHSPCDSFTTVSRYCAEPAAAAVTVSTRALQPLSSARTSHRGAGSALLAPAATSQHCRGCRRAHAAPTSAKKTVWLMLWRIRVHSERSIEHCGSAASVRYAQRSYASSPYRRPHRTPDLSTATTRSTSSRWAAWVSCPAVFTNSDWLAVNSFPGRAKLSRPRPPDAKEANTSGTAAGSPYGLLVTWQRTQSTSPARARIAAGRSLDAERSENGKRTKTTIPG